MYVMESEKIGQIYRHVCHWSKEIRITISKCLLQSAEFMTKFSKIHFSRAVKNDDILRDQNIGENRLIDSIKAR